MDPSQLGQAQISQDLSGLAGIPIDDSSRNLIVNYLPSSLNPTAFKNMFTPFGEVESCRIIYDKATSTSMGYGFVKYTTEESANKAIQIMNGQIVENKTLKVSLARPANPSVQQANLYVANLPKHYSKADLETMFMNFGPIIETKILLDPSTGVSKGVGFVRFASKEMAQIAMDSLNGQVPLGADSAIVVRFSDTREDKLRKGKSPSPAFGFGGGRLRYNPMGAAPAVAANPYGDMASQYVYQTPGAMPQGIPDATGGYMYAQQAVAPALAYCLFVYNLPPDADEGLLYRLFGPFGAISDVKIMREPSTNRCKGFGFVHYLKLEDAQQAIISMNGYQVGNKYLQVSFKKQK